MLSLSSAKAGSSAVKGFGVAVAKEPCVGVWLERKEVREGGRRGVVGLGGGLLPVRVRERERNVERGWFWFVCDGGSLGVDMMWARVEGFEMF